MRRGAICGTTSDDRLTFLLVQPTVGFQTVSALASSACQLVGTGENLQVEKLGVECDPQLEAGLVGLDRIFDSVAVGVRERPLDQAHSAKAIAHCAKDLSKKNTDWSCAQLGSPARVILRAPSWRRPISLFSTKGETKVCFSTTFGIDLRGRRTDPESRNQRKQACFPRNPEGTAFALVHSCGDIWPPRR